MKMQRALLAVIVISRSVDMVGVSSSCVCCVVR